MEEDQQGHTGFFGQHVSVPKFGAKNGPKANFPGNLFITANDSEPIWKFVANSSLFFSLAFGNIVS
jgi:hypothetical protein